jgi:Asp-tRNA(Asn)/Glu-tRNA(Gln) amidotransferase A subunit family amidase
MDRGAIVTEVPLPRGWEHVHGWHRTIMAYDCAREHAARFEQSPEHYLPQITSLIREGLAISPVDYAAAVDAQRIFQEDLFATYLHIDALVMPSTPTTAPARTTTGGPMFNSPWSFAHVPALTMPIGLAADGMPCGSQLVRPHGKTQADDFALLQVAGWCEAALNVNLWPELNRRLEAQFPYIQWIDRPC